MSDAVSRSILARLLAGERVVASFEQLERLIDYGCAQPEDSEAYRALNYMASIPNPRQLGTKDQLVAWLKGWPAEKEQTCST